MTSIKENPLSVIQARHLSQIQKKVPDFVIQIMELQKAILERNNQDGKLMKKGILIESIMENLTSELKKIEESNDENNSGSDSDSDSDMSSTKSEDIDTDDVNTEIEDDEKYATYVGKWNDTIKILKQFRTSNPYLTIRKKIV